MLRMHRFLRGMAMARPRQGRGGFGGGNPPQRPAQRVGVSRLAASRRQASYSAKRRAARYSAKSLISTVLDDTTTRPRRQVVRPSFTRYSPVLQSRATARVARSPNLIGQVISGVQLPQRALNCAQRQIRKEVLFALKLRGRGSAAPRRRRTETSKERCK